MRQTNVLAQDNRTLQLNQTLQQLMLNRNTVNVQQNLANTLQQLLVMGGFPAGGFGPGGDDDDAGDGSGPRDVSVDDWQTGRR